MKAKVNEACIGCGLCVSMVEEVFRMSDDGMAEAYGDVTEDNATTVQEAADSCPTSAIELE